MRSEDPRAPRRRRRTRRGRGGRGSRTRRRLRFARDRRPPRRRRHRLRSSGRRRTRSRTASSRGRGAGDGDGCVVKADGRVLRKLPLERRAFTRPRRAPAGRDDRPRETVDRRGRRSGRSVQHVLGLPSAAPPRFRAGRVSTRPRPAACGGSPSVRRYDADLRPEPDHRRGRRLERRALVPGRSTLKLAIAVTALARTDGKPGRARRSTCCCARCSGPPTTRRRTAGAYFGGSTSGGSAHVNSLMRSLGLVDTDMYGGYILGTRSLCGAPGSRACRRAAVLG